MKTFCIITLLFLDAMALGINLAKNGEPKGNYSFGYSLIAVIINIALLWGAGLFDNLGL